MSVIHANRLINLQANTDRIRNLCILAHVDHGKTTLSDALLSTNGIISSKNAGKIRYLDSREDEQERGITMESSGISLYFKVLRRRSPDNTSESLSGPVSVEEQEYLVNLIDSPGHVDFSSEVSTASRLCDGALVLVDVVEGVCTQTITVLKQAWTEHVRPILVLNKIDRLITELQMTPHEAYLHLCQILEQVNAVMATFLTGEILEEDARKLEEAKLKYLNDSASSENPSADFEWTLKEIDDAHIYFSPELGNVLFASAIHGWAFGIQHFAQLYASKLKIKESLLRSTLWGDYYLDPKTKRIIPHKALKGRNLKPMFVQFVLDNIWTVYQVIITNPNPTKIEKIVQTLNLKVLPRDLRSKDSQAVVANVMAQWLPLAPTVFLAAIDKLPSPKLAQPYRLPRLLYPYQDPPLPPKNATETAMYNCNSSEEVPAVVYVSKMFAVPVALLPENQRVQLTAEELRARGRAERERRLQSRAADESTPRDSATSTLPVSSTPELISADMPSEESPAHSEEGHALIGFCRLYSGILCEGQQLYVLSPKFNPRLPARLQPQHISQVRVGKLYLLMGRDLHPVSRVYAGNVFGMAGLGGHVLKSATLSTTLDCPSLSSVLAHSAPIVRAALEPVRLAEMEQLVQGLKLLNRADPCVEVYIQETGEHVLATAGELHLERCLTDLRERFARIEIHVSPPIIPFRETVVFQLANSGANVSETTTPVPKPALTNSTYTDVEGGIPPVATVKSAVVTVATSNQVFEVVLSCRPLPETVRSFLRQHQDTIRKYLITQKIDVEVGGLRDNDELTATLGDSLTTDRADDPNLTLLSLGEFRNTLKRLFKEDEKKSKTVWGEVVDRLWAFGPRHVGPNLLVNNMAHYQPRQWHHQHSSRVPSSQCLTPFRPSSPSPGDSERSGAGDPAERSSVLPSSATTLHHGITERMAKLQVDASSDGGATTEGLPTRELHLRDLEENIVTGFQLATLNGPLCAEPVVGLCYIVEDCRFTLPDASSTGTQTNNNNGNTSYLLQTILPGQVISTVREACRQSFLTWSPRLMLAMYRCEIQATAEVLGKVYAVLAKRRGRVISEEMKDGTSLFQIQAQLPVVESFGFADDIRKRTSGAASPQLVFSGFECLDEDPYWVPTTEEELEDLGEKADRENLAKKYVDGVRKRKGMFVEQKLVESAEKQRTLKK
ncbi:Cytoplasmic GTPase/eEF2-like protein (ribosomal biogenesis) [Dispira simplex]|nr:Cytoplasmic GTPase/eEF2-like protein (ribosomal biogenesis) [Dispira simplex]